MLQQAIIVHVNNASEIAESLLDYSAQDILDELAYSLRRDRAVLVRESFDGLYVVSHIVTEDMFYANATTAVPLSDQIFTRVTQL